MKRYLFVLIWISMAFNQVNAYVPINEKNGESILLNGSDWKFKLNSKDSDFYQPAYDDSGWDNILVPSNWEMSGFEEPVYRGSITESKGYYRKSFDVPNDWKGNPVFIRFDGVLFGYELWVNGNPAGQFESGFNRAEFEISGYLEFGAKNSLAVKVYKRFKGYEFDTHDAWSLSGIYRDVTLFAVNDMHISDFTIVTDLDEDFKDATLSCSFDIASTSASSGEKEFEIYGELKDAENNTVAEFSKTGKVTRHETVSIDTEIKNPEFWNAESPYLYTLELSLKEKGKIVHSLSQEVGFREIYVENGILKLNGKKITIKGVNHHDIYPGLGRALNKEVMLKDLTLMKEGNINAIRLSHYPPHPLFIKLCNEYGIYLIDEIPFGGGGDHLWDSSYQDILFSRAEATIERDKNEPSVIIWSVGNENPITPIVVKTAEYAKKLDPTRMLLFPGATSSGDQPDVIDVLAPHYPFFAPVHYALYPKKANVITEFGMVENPVRPYVFTEFNHSLGGSFEGLSRAWNMIKNYDHLAGGCIWMWNNQGIIRSTNGKKVLETTGDIYYASSGSKDIMVESRIDRNTVIDSRGQSGSDGIVMADRTPQADYWIAREVFSPLVFLDDEIKIGPGKQRISFRIENTYDFTDLTEVTVDFEFYVNGKMVQDGNLNWSQSPSTIQRHTLSLNAPDSLHMQLMFIKFKVWDNQSRYIADHTIKLIPEYLDVQLSKNFPSGEEESILEEKGSLIHKSYKYSAKMEVLALSNTTADELFSTAAVLRVGRQPEMAEIRNYDKTFKTFWAEYILDNPRELQKSLEESPSGYRLRMVNTYSRKDKGKTAESIEAVIEYEFNRGGWIDVSYSLTPVNVTDYFLELGLGLILPPDMNNLQWVGEGPYSAWYGQDDASKYGIYELSPDNLYYPGNKQNTELAVVSDKEGNGICILTDKNTISLEETEKGVIFSHVLLSAGKGNKTSLQISLKTHKASEIESVNGDFRIYPLEGNNWPEFLENLFPSN